MFNQTCYILYLLFWYTDIGSAGYESHNELLDKKIEQATLPPGHQPPTDQAV